jgi:uncharacterized membrane protein
MKKSWSSTIITSVIVTTLSLSATAHEAPTPTGMEKCYGVAKARKNQCGSSTHACATLAKQDNDPNSWIFLPQGTCERIVNGKTTEKK